MTGYFVAERRTRIQRLVGNGFTAPPPVQAAGLAIADQPAGAPARPTVAVFLPTMTGRLREDTTEAFLRGLIGQARDAWRDTGQALHLFVAVQHGLHSEAEARAALDAALAILAEERGREPFELALTAMVLAGRGKVRSLNAMTGIAMERGIEAAILIDDDVGFSPGCFSRLIEAYAAAEKPVAIGARKIGEPFDTSASRLLHRIKAYTQPAENYPHACCMIVTLDVIAPEIPPIYSSDDGYICFRLLRPELPDPLERLRLQDGTLCNHMVGGRTGKVITSRLRRILLHHHLFLSHFEPEKARYYVRNMLLYGLWPLVAFDRSRGFRAGAIKCLLKYVYAAWFLKIGAELVVRGLVSRPLPDIHWGSTD